MVVVQLEQFHTRRGSATSSSVITGSWHNWWYRFWQVWHSINLFPVSWLKDPQMQQVQSLRLIAKSKSMSSLSSTAMGWGEGVIEDEDNFALPDPLALGSSLGLLFGTPPPGTNWLKSRFSRSRFFSFSRPLLLNVDDTGGVGTLIGSPAFRCLMHSSNKAFNWISDSFDLECSNLK